MGHVSSDDLEEDVMSLCGQAPAQPAARSAATTRRRRPWPCEVQGLWLVRGEWLRLESEEEQVRWLQERALPQAGALDTACGRPRVFGQTRMEDDEERK